MLWCFCGACRNRHLHVARPLVVNRKERRSSSSTLHHPSLSPEWVSCPLRTSTCSNILRHVLPLHPPSTASGWRKRGNIRKKERLILVSSREGSEGASAVFSSVHVPHPVPRSYTPNAHPSSSPSENPSSARGPYPPPPRRPSFPTWGGGVYPAFCSSEESESFHSAEPSKPIPSSAPCRW